MKVSGETTPLVVHKDDDDVVSDVPSIWHIVKSGGIVLRNDESTARDHLANESTFLAWVRTSLSLLGVGIGMLKWNGIADRAAYLVLTLGTVVLIAATWRYLSVMKRLSQSRFEPNVTSALGVVMVILLVIIAMLILRLLHKL